MVARKELEEDFFPLEIVSGALVRVGGTGNCTRKALIAHYREEGEGGGNTKMTDFCLRKRSREEKKGEREKKLCFQPGENSTKRTLMQ